MTTPAAPRPFATGVVIPVCTPLTRDDAIDTDSLRRHLDHLIDHGVDGVFVLGTCGEFGFLTDAQRVEVVRTAVDHVGGRAPVLVGISDTASERAVLQVELLMLPRGPRARRSSRHHAVLRRDRPPRDRRPLPADQAGARRRPAVRVRDSAAGERRLDSGRDRAGARSRRHLRGVQGTPSATRPTSRRSSRAARSRDCTTSGCSPDRRSRRPPRCAPGPTGSCRAWGTWTPPAMCA